MMCSIRKTALLLATLMAAAVMPGCTFTPRTPGPEPIANAPLVVDRAMQLRQWEPVAAIYQNDTVMAGHTYAPFQPSRSDYTAYTFVEPGLFILNVLYMPINICINPMSQWVGYKSLSVQPTYTAMPPLPPSRPNARP